MDIPVDILNVMRPIESTQCQQCVRVYTGEVIDLIIHRVQQLEECQEGECDELTQASVDRASAGRSLR